MVSLFNFYLGGKQIMFIIQFIAMLQNMLTSIMAPIYTWLG